MHYRSSGARYQQVKLYRYQHPEILKILKLKTNPIVLTVLVSRLWGIPKKIYKNQIKSII